MEEGRGHPHPSPHLSGTIEVTEVKLAPWEPLGLQTDQGSL